MNTTAKILTAAILATSALGVPQNAHAFFGSDSGAASVKRINSEGFRACKALGDRGYTAIVRGLYSNGSERTGSGPFHIRTCFETAAQCERFIGRIRNHVAGIEELRYRKCSPRG